MTEYHQPTIDACVAIVRRHAFEWKDQTQELAIPMAMSHAVADMRGLTNPLAASTIDFPDLNPEMPGFLEKPGI